MNVAQQLVNGITIGHAYALVAVGWTLLLGAARLVNFGHGQMYLDFAHSHRSELVAAVRHCA